MVGRDNPFPVPHQCQLIKDVRNNSARKAAASGLGWPGGASRSSNRATPPAVKSPSHTWLVDRARPASRARSAKACWPLVAHGTTGSRSWSRGSVAARICVLRSAVSAVAMVSFVRFLPLPELTPWPRHLPDIATDYYRGMVLLRRENMNVRFQKPLPALGILENVHAPIPAAHPICTPLADSKDY